LQKSTQVTLQNLSIFKIFIVKTYYLNTIVYTHKTLLLIFKEKKLSKIQADLGHHLKFLIYISNIGVTNEPLDLFDLSKNLIWQTCIMRYCTRQGVISDLFL
jgi:hypothetical protein